MLAESQKNARGRRKCTTRIRGRSREARLYPTPQVSRLHSEVGASSRLTLASVAGDGDPRHRNEALWSVSLNCEPLKFEGRVFFLGTRGVSAPVYYWLPMRTYAGKIHEGRPLHDSRFQPWQRPLKLWLSNRIFHLHLCACRDGAERTCRESGGWSDAEEECHTDDRARSFRRSQKKEKREGGRHDPPVITRVRPEYGACPRSRGCKLAARVPESSGWECTRVPEGAT